MKFTSGQYLFILVPVRINFALIRYFSGKKAGNVFQKRSVHLLTMHVQLLKPYWHCSQPSKNRHSGPWGTFQTLRFPFLCANPPPLPFFFIAQAVAERPQALSETRKKLELRNHCNQNEIKWWGKGGRIHLILKLSATFLWVNISLCSHLNLKKRKNSNNKKRQHWECEWFLPKSAANPGDLESYSLHS